MHPLSGYARAAWNAAAITDDPQALTAAAAAEVCSAFMVWRENAQGLLAGGELASRGLLGCTGLVVKACP